MTEKKLLFTDSQGISLATSNLYVFEKKLQKVVAEFSALKLGLPLTRTLLEELISNPHSFVRGIYKSRIPVTDQHTGLAVNPEIQMSNLVMPDLTSLKETCYDLTRDSTTLYAFLPLFDISDTLILNSERVDQYLDKKYKYYSDNPAVIKKFNQLSQVAMIINAINAEIPFIQSTNSIVNYNLGELFRFNPDKEIELMQKPFAELARRL
jgi:hypothetical protein